MRLHIAETFSDMYRGFYVNFSEGDETAPDRRRYVGPFAKLEDAQAYRGPADRDEDGGPWIIEAEEDSPLSVLCIVEGKTMNKQELRTEFWREIGIACPDWAPLPQDELAWMPEDPPETTAAVAALEEKKILRFCAERGIIVVEDDVLSD